MKRWLAAATMALGLSAPSAASSPTDALVDLLRKQPGVERVTTCIPEGAQDIIVHLMQAHNDSPAVKVFADQHGTAEERALVDEYVRFGYAGAAQSQGHLYNILGALSKAGYRDIHSEGVAYESAEFVTRGRVAERYVTILNDLLQAGIMPAENWAFVYRKAQEAQFMLQDEGMPIDVILTPDDPVANAPPASFERFRYVPGADLVRYVEGDITLLPLERLRWQESASCGNEEYVRHDGRENAMIQLMLAYNDDPVHIAVLGANHALGGPESCPGLDLSKRRSSQDNIALRNQGKGRKVGLIEVSTVGLDAFTVEIQQRYEKLLPVLESINKRVEQETGVPSQKTDGCGPFVTMQ